MVGSKGALPEIQVVADLVAGRITATENQRRSCFVESVVGAEEEICSRS